MPACVHRPNRPPRRVRITIDVTGLLEGTNHAAVMALLDRLSAVELKALAMKVHGALYRRLEGPAKPKQDPFPWLDTLGYPRGW